MRSIGKNVTNKIWSELPQNGSFERRVASVRDVTEWKLAEDRLERLNKTFLELTPDFDRNIKLITESCGELLGAICAMYHRMGGRGVCSFGRWQTPNDYNPSDKEEGHLCYDVLKLGKDRGVYIVHNLQTTSYLLTDPIVARYGLKTFVGHPVISSDTMLGSLCAVYQEDVVFDDDDKRILRVLARAIGIEEERKRAGEGEQRCPAELEEHRAEKTEALDPLTGGIAHEFNNLLIGIQGDVSLLLLETDLSHPHYERLKSIKQQVKSGRELTRQLLSLASGGKYEAQPADLDLNDLIEKSSEMFGNTKKETLLIVDDEKMIVDVGVKVLKRLGYDILIAGNRKEAIETYRANQDKIDIVILDMTMAGMGFDGAYVILKGSNPAIEAILSNGHSIKGHVNETLEGGFDGFIQKPFRMQQLSQKIREILDDK